jgi:hypothetical protein
MSSEHASGPEPLSKFLFISPYWFQAKGAGNAFKLNY